MKKFLCPLLLLLSTVAANAQQLTVTPEKEAPIYSIGEPITWSIRVKGDGAQAIQNVNYVVKKDGQTIVSQGMLPLQNGAAQLEVHLDDAGAVLADFSFEDAQQKTVKVAAGALVEPFKIEPSRPEPADFQNFWHSKIEALEEVPINAALASEPSGVPTIDYWKVTLDNIGGTKVQGQLARPTDGEKFPALLRLQYAGVYGLGKGNVISYARKGWLTLNINAHDLPIDQTNEFYATQAKGPLKNYMSIGAESRETSYFLRMVLSCYRAIDYLQTRPDWDGKTLVVEGTSQGGMQSLMMGGLNPAVTAVIVNVPAGGDTTGPLIGRAAPWPYWANMAEANARILETSRYYDALNFARHIKVPTLVAVGLLDTVATPTSILATFNQIESPTKMLVIMPLSDHQGRGGAQAAYGKNSAIWLQALAQGEAPPTSESD